MFIDGLVNSGALPVLEAATQFAARRHTIIQHNIANLSTPDFRGTDVSVDRFQHALGRAIDQRRRTGGSRGDLPLEGTAEVGVTRRGGGLRLELRPRTASGNVLFHDRNDRDLERSMQALAENTAAFRVATELFRGRIALLQEAIRERP